jgi:two-component system, NarL family, nitrate/nitrite response regulator NarL
MRAGIKDVLSVDRLYNVAAVAQTGAECLEIIMRLRPDVALIDAYISLPGATRILHESNANGWQTRFCFLTRDQIPPDLLEAGKDAAAVFVNERLPEDLRERLREIAMDLKSKAADGLQSRAAAPAGAGSASRLTSRQNQIVAMLKIGSSNREIADVLGLSEGTIKVHLHRIYRKIGVSNRTQLAARSFATELGTRWGPKSGDKRKI